MSIEERMRHAKVILRELGCGPLTWGELERRVFRSSGTHWKFTALMRWLTDEGYIVKDGPQGTRAPYRVNLDKVQLENDEVKIKID